MDYKEIGGGQPVPDMTGCESRRNPFGPAIVAAAFVLLAGGCSGGTERPSRPGLTLDMPATVTGRYVACGTCEIALTVVSEFTVRVGDPAGSGGSVESLVTIAAARGTVVAQNRRPNESFVFPDTRVPAGGVLDLSAGIVIAPAPPPRDIVEVTVRVTLADGRSVIARAPMAVLPAE